MHPLLQLGPGAIFLSILVENLGVPLPTELAYLAGIVMVNSNKISWLGLFWLTTSAHVLGAAIAYWIARSSHRWLEGRFRQYQGFHKTAVALEKWFSKYGSATVVVARVIGYVRPWSSFVAGLSEYEFWPFLGYTFAGTALFNVGVFYFSRSLMHVWHFHPLYRRLIVGVMLLSFFLIFVYAWWRNKSRND